MSCPISALNKRIVNIITFIEMVEGGEMASSTRLPSALLDETNAYFVWRDIILGERGQIRDEQSKRRERKNHGHEA
jgi:hypothetical protein